MKDEGKTWRAIDPEFWESDIVTEIRRQVNGDKMLIVWLKMLSRRSDGYKGITVWDVSLTHNIHAFAQGLAGALDEPDYIVLDLLDYLASRDMIQETEKGLSFDGFVPDGIKYVGRGEKRDGIKGIRI